MSDLSNFRTQVRSVPHKKDAVLYGLSNSVSKAPTV